MRERFILTKSVGAAAGVLAAPARDKAVAEVAVPTVGSAAVATAAMAALWLALWLARRRDGMRGMSSSSDESSSLAPFGEGATISLGGIGAGEGATLSEEGAGEGATLSEDGASAAIARASATAASTAVR